MTLTEARRACDNVPFPAVNDTQVQHNRNRLREMLARLSNATLQANDEAPNWVIEEVKNLRRAIAEA